MVEYPVRDFTLCLHLVVILIARNINADIRCLALSSIGILVAKGSRFYSRCSVGD